MGVEEAIIPWPLLSRSAGTSEPASTQAATTNINPNATMNAMRIQASPTPCSAYSRTRSIGEAQGEGYTHLRAACPKCGRIADVPWPLLLGRKGTMKRSSATFP